MQPRYALRFENGERQGETIPIRGLGVSIGRKPGNSVQILDPSVSGRHAEFVVEDGGVVLRDLGSTNGTRVGGERVSEKRLAHGDEVLLGNVKLVLIDGEVGGAEAPQAERTAPAAQPVGDTVRTISAERVQRAGKRSIIGAFAVLAALGLAAGAWWWFGRSKGDGPGALGRPVEPVAGNLLSAGFSFEGDTSSWEAETTAPSAFAVDAGSRRSGDNGFGADLADADWALARSAAVRVASARALVARAAVRVEGAADARIGVEFESPGGAAARSVAWGATLAATGAFEEFELALPVPPGFDVARVVLLARSAAKEGGSVDVDDVSLCPGGEAQGAQALDEYQLAPVGSPATGAVLFKIDRTLFSDFHVRRGEGVHAERAELSVDKQETGFALGLGSGGGRTLSLRIDEPLLKGGVATLGTGGYRAHAGEFTREGTTGLILGAGKDLVRIGLPEPVTLRARPEGAGVRVEAALAGGASAQVQLVFRSERDQAQTVARDAREAEKQGRLGECAALWGKLRDELPFEPTLLAEAETTRTRLAERGLSEVRDLRKEVERARFFRLVDLYRRCRREAEAIAARYEGSEVEAGARELAGEIEGDLSALEADLDRAERERMEAIARALEAAASAKLAARVRSYVARHLAPPAGAPDGGR